MADFCTLCSSYIFGDFSVESINEDNFIDLLISSKFIDGPEINIEKIFDEHMKNDLENFKNNSQWTLRIDGICEGCGMIAMCVEIEDDIPYLVVRTIVDYENMKIKNFRIATISPDLDIEWYIDGIKTFYNENMG